MKVTGQSLVFYSYGWPRNKDVVSFEFSVEIGLSSQRQMSVPDKKPSGSAVG